MKYGSNFFFGILFFVIIKGVKQPVLKAATENASEFISHDNSTGIFRLGPRGRNAPRSVSHRAPGSILRVENVEAAPVSLS